MNTAIYKIETLTNLHVGSGDANYGVIDNLVQRDVTTGFPVINGSSLKGALKEYFESKGFGNITDVFGDDNQMSGYKFLSAKLLAIPVRSNKKPYFLATCPAIINQFNKDATNFGLSVNLNQFANYLLQIETPIIFGNNPNGLLIEDFENFQSETAPNDCDVFGNCSDLVIFNDADFAELVNDFNLPVVARNRVEKDKNLWYEQVVPSKSLFYFIIIHNDKHLGTFEIELQRDVVHIGANATVGYGFTKITKL